MVNAMRLFRGCRYLMVLALSGLLASCSLFDSGVEWRGGPYALLWIDTSENISICRELDDGGCIGRIDSTVFAVGWDGRYLVAKQHPNNDRAITHYFILDARKDTTYADPSKSVLGPLTAIEFQRKSDQMKLPAFSKVLAWLE